MDHVTEWYPARGPIPQKAASQEDEDAMGEQQ
jgi:hypothetical protein